MLISVIGSHGRVLQAHWDGRHVVIRNSSLVHLKVHSWEPFNTILRYMAKSPSGDTKSLQEVQPSDSATPS